MKIAHLVSSQIFAGIEQHVYELSSFMSDVSDQVIICDESIHHHMGRMKTQSLDIGSRYSPLNTYKLIKFLNQNNVSILHCHGAKASTIGKGVKIFSNIKVVSTIHGHKKNNNAFTNLDAVIGVNKLLIENIPKGTYIPNWFNPSHAGERSSRTGPIIAIGRLEPVKGFNQLIKSWINIQEDLEIIGSGPEEQNLHQLIHDLNLSDRIKIVTNCDYSSIEKKYKTTSGLIVSSHREGGPRVVLEAINHEIPVLGSKVGIISDLIPNECLSEPGNQESLQALLEEMVPLLAQLNMEGIKAALIENYSITSAAKKTKEIYEALLRAN
ncbi:MAG: glycosyltransferase [SAR86 cluster bacterium]|uniref:Glycosyltransferase n=1 Tax=SAR86 cluster bacterium TaxID=2030880 RepID=A0A520LU48_9GAMM|nr:MAG: glycosyltransferase [SAR86 cluster bacterium]